MAIIQCPACNARMSSKATQCSQCQYDLVNQVSADGLNAEQMASKMKLARIKKRYSLQMQAMASIILVLSGLMLWYFVGNRGFNKITHFIELGMAVVGGVWYLVNRYRQYMFKNHHS